MNQKPSLGLGLIGSGFMGKTHVFGFATANRVFDMPFDIRFECIADQNTNMAESARANFGFARASADWHTLLNDPNIDIVDITTPNALHKEMALAALAAGKHVYCEKPLAPRATDAAEMADAAATAAATADVCTQVGFNYLANPMFKLARQMIEAGELGEIRSYRGIHAEDYMADSNALWTWRHDPVGGGALADLGSHALATAEYLLGPVDAVFGDCHTAIRQRPDANGVPIDVEVDDATRVMLQFGNGASGSIEANWIATGRKMQHDFEVYGSKGAVLFSQERLNELKFFQTDDKSGRQGFRTILAAPEHEPYARFCVAPGHQLGFNDLKAIEVNGFVSAIGGLCAEPFNFKAGLRIQQLVESIQASATSRQWQSVTG